MGYLGGAALAFWFGIQTAISPCPLATNIAAISYIGRRVTSSRQVLLAGLLYTVGRTLVYVGLGILLVASLLVTGEVSRFLQKYMNMLLGPVLILVAMFLLELITFRTPGVGVGEKLQRRVNAMGVWGALLLGVVFALSFCPLSAGYFFGVLIPLAIEARSSVGLPTIFGVATALPVLTFAVIIALSAQSLGKAFNALSQVEWWARRITGVLFLAIGIHFSLKHMMGVTPFWDPWLQVLIDAVWQSPQ
jgi:cytochrome c-type biogenesis protein